MTSLWVEVLRVRCLERKIKAISHKATSHMAKRVVLTLRKIAGDYCGCMLAKQMGGYSNGCALSGKGHIVRPLLAWPEVKCAAIQGSSG